MSEDIVIMGAGAAGVGAARRLAAAGVRATVVEALPRVGGRAWTVEAAGYPLDLGCGWLHSGDRNAWTRIAGEIGMPVDARTSAWGRQHRELGLARGEQEEARRAFNAWSERLADAPPASDRASDALEPGSRWNAYIHALSGFISGDEPEHISASDIAAYDAASTGRNWRVPGGYGALVAASLPPAATVHLATSVDALRLDETRVVLETSAGTMRARAVVLTVSSDVLSGGAIRFPAALDPWREAAGQLPLGRDEKLFLEIVDGGPFETETHLIGDPHDATTGVYYIRPFGRPVIECFFGGAGARLVAANGTKATFARCIDQLAGLLGSGVRDHLRPLVASDWAGTPSIRGGYSYARPGRRAAREVLARPYDGRIFFAGEATHTTDFSTAHGAHDSGVRAAEELLAAVADLDAAGPA
ncbi:flavin monoamine oxidase family protein [Acuticoccus sediminis]|uniref:flavin monoamine oxidase family protein n=1 Tax=Acuticoccus sediminis TaxID=2184697 RepID=UPI001CFEB458|nr:NAD(P)/FAD-dependent oxidoreductase [Acuticoccus sediminis]